MSGHDEPPANRTVFRPSPLQGRRDAQASELGSRGARVAAPSLSEDDIPEPAVPPDHRNPLIAACARLLSLFASVRSGRAGVPLPKLHTEASAVIADLDRRLAGRYDQETLRRARYALCVTGDDIALNLPGNPPDSAEWARRALAVRFFGETIGGDRFWTLLDEMVVRPADNQDLLELYHACLAGGFEGRYRITDHGRRLHQETMQRVYRVIDRSRAVSPLELSPNWRGQPEAENRLGFWTPITLAAIAASAVLLLIYVVLRLVLAATGVPATDALAAINPTERLTLSRQAAPPPPPLPGGQAAGLRAFLADELAQHLVEVVEDPRTVRVRTTVGQLFKPGSDQLEPGRAALFGRIGEAIEKAGKTDAGPVTIAGFTDNTPIHNTGFGDNTVLSEARARTVAELVRARLSHPGAVVAKGYGDAAPLESNDTAGGRAANRRVEVVVNRMGG